MRIALIVHDFTPDTGHGRYCLELARHLRGRHQIHAFANRFDDEALEFVKPHRVPALRATALASVLSFTPSVEPARRRASASSMTAS